MGIGIWASKEEDKEIQRIAGIIIPEGNGDITFEGKKIGYSDSFIGHMIFNEKICDVLKEANKFCIWNS